MTKTEFQVKLLLRAVDSYMREQKICPEAWRQQIAESWALAHPSSLGRLALWARMDPPSEEAREGFVDEMRRRAGLTPIVRVRQMAG